MEKQDNKPLCHTWIVVPIQELPWGSCLKEQLSPSPTLAGLCTAEFTWQKEGSVAWKNVSNQYINAADYCFEVNTMSVMTAADKARVVKPSVATSDSYRRAEDDEMKCLSLCNCCRLTSGWK